jgi:alkylhydroperoxidase family enzyme
MLDYCAKLTRTPGEMAQGDVDRLREAGLSEAAVHDVCLITSYFGFVNRIADGLGVELEGRWKGGPKVERA